MTLSIQEAEDIQDEMIEVLLSERNKFAKH